MSGQFVVSIPFREDLHSDAWGQAETEGGDNMRFHPFQGRPSFGQKLQQVKAEDVATGFHPFQGRPSFGPSMGSFVGQSSLLVSIPFREDLHSDHFEVRNILFVTSEFPSLSGKTFIRTANKNASVTPIHSQCFHPFQGRPSFGLHSQ